MISLFKQFFIQSRGSLKITLPLKASSVVQSAWTQTKSIGIHRCLYHHNCRRFMDYFKKDKKLTQNNPEIFRKKMEELFAEAKAENQVEPREERIYEIFRLLNEAKNLEQQSGQKLLGQLRDKINEIEVFVDSRDDWIVKDSYQIKFMFLQVYLEVEDEPRVQRYCEEFMNPCFLEEVFEKFDSQLKIIFTLFFSELMLNRNQFWFSINLIKTFLEQLSKQSDAYRLSSPVRQKLFSFMIQSKILLGQHHDAFQDIEEVIQIINSKDYSSDVQRLHHEQILGAYNMILAMQQYCFSHQQYAHALRLGDGLLKNVNSTQQQEFQEFVAYSVNILKNLDKYYQILLELNKQFAKEQPRQEEKATGTAAELEEKYLKSFEKFLRFQSEFIQHCNRNQCPIYSQPLIEDTIRKLSSEGKQAILKISHKYDCVSV